MVPTDQSFTQLYQVMEIGTDIYKITRWEDGYIDAVPMRSNEACRTVSLNFNFKTKEFFETTRNTGQECKFMNKTVWEKLPKPRLTQIVDGTKIIQVTFNDIHHKAYGYLSSDFRKRVEEAHAVSATVQSPKDRP